MKHLWLCMTLLVWSSASLALQVTGLHPAPNSEGFSPSDTVRITFDGPPNGVGASDILFQGMNACYPITTRIQEGNTLFVIPAHYWLTGDKITITVRSPAVSTPYMAQFRVNVAKGQIAGTWTGGQMVVAGHVPLGMTAIDMDGDGPVDLAIIYSDELGIARNILYDDPCNMNCAPFDGQVSLIDPQPGFSNGPRVLRAADLDQDGRPELIASNFGQNTLVVYRNISTPGFIQFADTSQIVLDLTSPRDFRLTDIDADGRVDIVVLGQHPDPAHDRMAIYLNDGNANFDFPSQEFETGSGPTMLDVSDLSTNNRPDLTISCVHQRALNRFRLLGFNPLNFAVDTLFGGLPSGPDGVIADNLSWDAATQRPDLLVWSRGAHTLNGNRGRQALDESPYVFVARALGGNQFAQPDSIENLAYTPLSITLVDLDATIGNSASHEWVVISETGLHFYDADILPIEVYLGMAPIHPQSCLTFDADLDGDMDLFFVDAVSDNSGRIVYDRNPDIALVASQVIHFGTVQNRCSVQRVHTFHNDGPFPATICNATVPNSEDGVYTLVTPTQFPITVAPSDSLPIQFSYTPCFSDADSGLARVAFYGGVGGCHQYSVYLYGRSGLAQIRVLPDTLIDFGFVERGGSVLDSFQIYNHGTFDLNGYYDPSTLDYFTYLGPNFDFAAPGETTPQRLVRFDAPLQSPDTVIIERMKLLDSTLCSSCPDQPELSSRWIYFRQHIITNRRPVFTFPPGALFEGASGTLSVVVRDSNAAMPRQRVVSRFTELEPLDRSLSIAADTLWQWQDTIHLQYQVADSVTWPLELFELTFSAIDTPINEPVDTVWYLSVQAINDLPRFITIGDVTVIEGTNLVNWILARVGDEENNPIVGQYDWLGAVPAHATVTPPVSDLTFRLNWQTSYDDAGVYPLKMTILENGNPARAATDTVFITIIDRPPNLSASLEVIPDTTTYYSNVSVSWEVRETDMVPVQTAFNVRLVQTGPYGDTLTLRNSTYTSLPGGGSVSGILPAGPLDDCGSYIYTLTVTPTESDGNPADDVALESVWVICPDLAAYVAEVPDTVERGESFTVHFQISEVHGVAVQAPFTAVLTDEQTGDTLLRRNYSVVIEPWGTLADSVAYSSLECGPHAIMLLIIPPTYYDDDPSNNVAGTTMRVWCPDLAVLRVTAPPQVHKHTSFRVDFVIGEVNGIDMEASFSASVFVSGMRQDFYFDFINALDSIGGSTDAVATTKGVLPILVRLNPPPGQDRNPLNDTLSTSIEVLADPFMAYPLPFTPNADRYNDTLYFAFGDEIYQAPVVKIFTVEGRLVRTLDRIISNSLEWDGRDDDGRECLPGPYLYTFDDGGKKVSSGIVYVAR